MEKIIVYERKPFYYETDRMDVVHHSNYIRWFEEARVHFMEKVGYSYAKMEAEGLMMPVISVNCEYRSAVRFGDTVLVETAVTGFNGFKMSIQYLVKNKATGELCARGFSTHCVTDSRMRPVRIKKTYPQLYELYAGYVTEPLFTPNKA